MNNEEFLSRTALSMGVNPSGDRLATYSSNITLLKFANFSRAFSEGALEHNLCVLSIESTSAGWLREKVSFCIKGPESDVYNFMKALGRALDDYERNGSEPAKKPAKKSKWFPWF